MKENVRLRAVGGWIRDKLLVQQKWVKSKIPLKMAEDIDIVIETDHLSARPVSAYEFAVLAAK